MKQRIKSWTEVSCVDELALLQYISVNQWEYRLTLFICRDSVLRTLTDNRVSSGNGNPVGFGNEILRDLGSTYL